MQHVCSFPNWRDDLSDCRHHELRLVELSVVATVFGDNLLTTL
jgi:hypothetical protein